MGKLTIIATIPHKEQKYDTVGNYWTDREGNLQIRVSDLQNPKMEMLIVIHELIEKMLVDHAGISDDDITAFDEKFEKKRLSGNIDEPGDDKNCNYKKEHCIATGIERIMCSLLGVDWKTYEEKCNNAK